MGSGDLNMKKSWHPLLHVNQERVWKQEKKAYEERKKLDELKRERDQEREMQELQRLQEEAGGKKRIDKVDWMYATPAAGSGPSASELEDYLLGKKRVDQFLQQKAKESNQATTEKSKDVFMALQNANTANDVAAKIREDPMFAIKQQEQAAYQALLKDPTRLRQMRAAAGLDVEDKEEKRRRKEEKRRMKEERRLRDEGPRHDGGGSRSRYRDDQGEASRDHYPQSRKSDRYYDQRSDAHHHRRERYSPDDEYPRFAPREPYRNGCQDYGRQDEERRYHDRGPDSWSYPRRDDNQDEPRHRSTRRSTSPSRQANGYQRRRSPSPRRSSPPSDRRRYRSPPARDTCVTRPPRSTYTAATTTTHPPPPTDAEAEREAKLARMQSNAQSLNAQRTSYLDKIKAEEAQELAVEEKARDRMEKRKEAGKASFLLDQQKMAFKGDLSERLQRAKGALQRVEAD